MTLRHYLKRALTLPPQETARRALTILRAKARTALTQWRDQRFATYSRSADLSVTCCLTPHDAERCLPQLDRDRVIALADSFCDHRFDLLGSGWVQVRHGITCAGVEDYRYDPGEPVTPGPDGRWLEGRVNPPNLPHARRIWRLIAPGYVPIDWALDFKSGWRWRETQRSVEVRYGLKPGVDVKVPWELARMQHLPMLAYAYFYTRDDRYWHEFRHQVLDFVATNPPRWGVNWSCTMDVAIRAANWTMALDLFHAFGARVDQAFTSELARALVDHGFHVMRHLEWTYSLRSNHYLSNVCGLAFVAAHLPHTPLIDAWLAFAAQEIVAEMALQFHADGSNFEGSTSYHRLSTEMVVYAVALLEGVQGKSPERLREYDHRRFRGIVPLSSAPLQIHASASGDRVFPAWLYQRLWRARDFTLQITRPGGHIPQFGDNDSGRFFKLNPRYFISEGDLREDLLDHHHLIDAVSGLFAGDDLPRGPESAIIQSLCKGRVSLPQPESHSQAVRIGAAMPDMPADLHHARVEIPLPEPGALDDLHLHAFPDFGLFIFQSARVYLAVRCGPVGQMGNGGHAHNDQLGLELTIDGETWIADPGTYLYTPLPEVRNRYRSARAHFVPRPAGRDAEPGALDLGLFRLPDQTKAECLYFGPDGFAGRHHGYGQPVYRVIRFGHAALIIDDYGMEPLTTLPEPIANSPGYGLIDDQPTLHPHLREQLTLTSAQRTKDEPVAQS
jgi:hypothetical protein